VLHREDDEGLIVVSQPAHAWVAGQMARQWGNAEFGEFAPHEEVCLAAEQHDIGWLQWEQAPTLNVKTGRPHTFMELAVPTHTAMWSSAEPLSLQYGRYPALLVSMHGTGLYEKYHDSSKDSSDDLEAIDDFLTAAHAFQEGLLCDLREDPLFSRHATLETITRNQRLVAVWDWLSLILCMGLKEKRKIDDVPVAKGKGKTLQLTPVNGDGNEVRISPWPFKRVTLTLRCEGRRLPGKWKDCLKMREALQSAPWVPIQIELRA